MGMNMEWQAWVPAIISSTAVSVLTVAGGYLLKASVEKTVSHVFEREIEKLKSDLKVKEAQITDLRSGALSVLHARHTELDKRKLRAAEVLWISTMREGRLKTAVNYVSRLDIDKVREVVDRGGVDAEKIQKLGEVLYETAAIQAYIDDKVSSPYNERLFIPDNAWIAFQALSMITTGAVAILLALKTKAPLSLIKDNSETNELLKKVLPTSLELIDRYPERAAYFLVDQLQDEILVRLRTSIQEPGTEQQVMKGAAAIVGSLARGGPPSGSSIEIPEEVKAEPPKL